MTSREQVLQVLENRAGETVSGEELAAVLGISRTAVWKAIGKLREEGHHIEAGTNRGYRLIPDRDILSPQGIAACLEEPEAARNIRVYPELDSTNLQAKRLALEGAPDGTAVLAECQTAGRGRRGRSFYSPPGSGLYLSLLLRPEHLDAGSAVLVTTAVSVAVCRAVEQVTGQHLQIKWVNDLYREGKKVCGILTEAVTGIESGELESVVVGIGINVEAREFPEELRQVAGALYERRPPSFTRNRLAAAIIRQLRELDAMIADRSFLPEYRERSMVLGKPVLVYGGGEPEEAVAEEIDGQGALLVRHPDGSLRRLSTGEITIRLQQQKGN